MVRTVSAISFVLKAFSLSNVYKTYPQENKAIKTKSATDGKFWAYSSILIQLFLVMPLFTCAQVGVKYPPRDLPLINEATGLLQDNVEEVRRMVVCQYLTIAVVVSLWILGCVLVLVYFLATGWLIYTRSII